MKKQAYPELEIWLAENSFEKMFCVRGKI